MWPLSRSLLFYVDFILRIHIKARKLPASVSQHTLRLESYRKGERFSSPAQPVTILRWSSLALFGTYAKLRINHWSRKMQCSDYPGLSHLPTLELRQKVNSSRSLCTQSREGGCSYQAWQKFLNYKNTYTYTYADRKQRAFKEVTEDRSTRELFTQIWGELREINKALSSTRGLAPVEGHDPL